MQIEIALDDPVPLRDVLEAGLGGQGVVREQSDYRDFSILEVTLTTVTSGALGVVFDLLKEYLKGRLPKQPQAPGQAISVRVGEVVVTIDPAADDGVIDAALRSARDAAGG